MFCLPKNFNYVKLITLIKTAKIYLISKLLCGCSTSVVRGLPKPRRRVRLPSPAPFFYQLRWEANPEGVSA